MVKTRSKSTKPSSSVPAGATARPTIDRNTLRRRHNTITGQAARNEDDPARYSHALIRQFLECPVCLNIFRGKIFMCDNGHNLCESCFNRNRTLATESWSCPVGRCPFTMSPLRNYLVEKLIVGSQIKLDCPHPGCTERMTSERLNEHVRECSFEPIECPAKDSANTCGGTMTRSDFNFHFLAHHSRPDPGKANVIIVPIPGQWWGVHTQKDPLGSNCNLHYIVRVVKTDSLLRVDAVANLRDPRYADLAVEVRLAHANTPPSVYSGCSLVDLQAPIKGLLVEGAMCPNIGVHCMLVKKEEPEEDEELDYSD